jgi:toxin ParE1/3/4
MELKNLECLKLINILMHYFEYFDIIAKSPFSFESVDYIKTDYRRCVCGSDSIYYKIGDNNIVKIMAIIGKQDFKNIL